MENHQIIFNPIITEKAMTSRGERKYVFLVHPRATKIAVRNAVSKMFKVKVSDVNTIMHRGKTKVHGYKVGRTPATKKAYVTLVEGQKIEELEF